MKYIAHSDEETKREQGIAEHLAALAAGFAEVFGAQSVAYFCGMLRDSNTD